ncbi:MAG: HlyD family efflux transporter periplasmic adaptor subunit [Acidobacteriaceae bacterium]|nr:HlyD family efflux transporter periplasmic adaptor subunit [Acidobacteriaceae bacterium]
MSEVQTAPPQRTEQQKQQSSPPAPSESQPKQAPSRKRFVPLIFLLVLIVAGIAVWKIFFSQPKLPDNIVALSGRIEGDDSAVSPKTTGRILEVRFREGDAVKAGDVIAVLDDQQVHAREEQAQAAVLQANASLRSAQQQITVLQEQLQQAQLQTDQSKVDAEGRVRQADAELAAAEADYAQQQHSLELAVFDRDAYTRLAKSGAVSERQGKQAVTTAATQEAAVAAAQRRVEAARGALNIAKSSLANPEIRNAASAAVRRQIAQQQAEIASAAADAARARAQLLEAQANRKDLIVTAPFNGTIVTRTAEPGEVVQAGTAVVTMLDLSKVYLRGFVPEGQIGKVKIDQPAHIYLDSNPSQALDAYVSRVDPQATFTPENTYFRNDRVKQVVGVKLQLKSGIGYAKPGMPADGEILVSGDTWPPERKRR